MYCYITVPSMVNGSSKLATNSGVNSAKPKESANCKIFGRNKTNFLPFPSRALLCLMQRHSHSHLIEIECYSITRYDHMT